MGFYERWVFPRLMNAFMRGDELSKLRREVLAGAGGRVLEIGFGTGLNLPHYPSEVTEVVGVDVNRGMESLARERAAASAIPVELVYTDGGPLPFADASFDTAVSTWTLCSVAEVSELLREIRRVLRPGGRFHFLEHGLSNEPSVQKWQNRLNPVNRIVACGCNINRSIRDLVSNSFRLIEVKEFYLPKEPKVLAYFYQGVGTPTDGA